MIVCDPPLYRSPFLSLVKIISTILAAIRSLDKNPLSLGQTHVAYKKDLAIHSLCPRLSLHEDDDATQSTKFDILPPRDVGVGSVHFFRNLTQTDGQLIMVSV